MLSAAKPVMIAVALVKPPSCTTSRPAASGPKLVMTRPEPLQNATAVERTWVGNSSHCGRPTEELSVLTGKLLEVSAELIEVSLRLELQAGAVVADVLDGRRCMFLAGLHRAEREIAEKLKALSVGSPSWPSIDADKAIPWVEKRTNLTLVQSQVE